MGSGTRLSQAEVRSCQTATFLHVHFCATQDVCVCFKTPLSAQESVLRSLPVSKGEQIRGKA